jgi:hypothetical protein
MSNLNLRFHGSWLFILLLCCWFEVAAQEKNVQSPLTGLALEIFARKDAPPSYLSVPGAEYGSNYPRLSSWKEGAGVPEQTAIKLDDVMEGDAVRIKVSVLKGRFRENEVVIGSYLLMLGQRTVVEEMASYGYQPLEMGVVRLNSAVPTMPAASSKAASIEVVSIVERRSNFPSYAVVLHNNSHKDVTELVIYSFHGGANQTILWEQKSQNRPLITAGGTVEVIVFGEGPGEKTRDVYTPSSPDKIGVATSVFADRTYEGESGWAAKYLARLDGQKIQVARAIALLESNSIEDSSSQEVLLANLQSHVTALSREATPEAVPRFMESFPDNTSFGAGNVKGSIEIGLNDVRKELLKDIQSFSLIQDRDYDKWRTDLKLKYEEWLSRL